MRSAVLILVPLVLLASLFYFVVVRGRPGPEMDPMAAQTQVEPATRKVVPTTVPDHNPSAGFVGSSNNVWIETLNRRTGALANRFRAARFDPRPDRAVDVTFPEAQFYGDNGSVVTLEGSRGKVTVSQPGENSDPRAVGASTPTEGDLEDVIIRFYDESANGEPAGEPSLVAQVNRVHFDAIGNRVTTIDSVIDGKGVVAERVPVTVRGRDFEFDGYGLSMQWNDRDGRLESLEINKGERLLIKNLGRLGLPDQTATAPKRDRIAVAPAGFLTGILQSDAAPTSTAPDRPAQLYHATFDREVQIIRDGKPIAAGDVMRVVIPLGEVKADRVSSTTRATPSEIAAPPATRRTAPRRAATTKREPTTAPASQVEVRWTGPLTVRPIEAVTDAPRTQMVELVGSPAWIEENGSRADARLIRAEPDTGRLRMEPGGTVRAISMRDTSGAHLRSRSALIVDRTAGLATIEGGGQLTTPATDTQPDATTVTWTRRLKVAMSGGDDGWLKQIEIEGEANVANPQVNVTSDALTMRFAEPTTRPTSTTRPSNMRMPASDLSSLQTVLATGNAKMEIGVDAARRSLAASRIELGLVPGKANDAALETVRCNDQVTLADAAGFSLACGNLDVKLKPTSLNQPASASEADPLADIERLIATQAVALKQADGSTAVGERLELTGAAGAKRMALDGAPARVASPRGALEGERIVLDPASGDVDVPGPGRLLGSGDEKQPNATLAIAWVESMKATGATGVCDLSGGVRINGSNATGTRMDATAKSGRILFMPRESGSKPTTAPAAPAVASASLDTLRAVQLNGEVDIAMQSADARTSSVQTEQLDIDWENGTLTAPKPGRLMVVDGRKPAATQPATQTSSGTIVVDAATRPTPRASRFGPGSLAIAWQQQLLWNMREGKLTFDGGVRLGFEREGTDDPIRMNCDRIICDLAPIQSGQGVDQMAQRIDLRGVVAEQNVSVRSKTASFDAAALRYDAATNRATATGDALTPVEVFDADATSRVGFSQITWNVETGLIEDFRDIDGRLRR